MHFALVVIPDLAARPRENGFDRQKEAHLLRFKDAALRINKRDALTLKHEAWFKLSGSQVIVDFTQPTHMLEGCRAHQGVAGVNGHRRHDHPLKQFSLCQVKASGSGYCLLSKGGSIL